MTRMMEAHAGTASNFATWAQVPEPSRLKTREASSTRPAPGNIPSGGARDIMNTGFWAFYRGLKGAAAYEGVGSQAFSVEQAIRMEAAGLLNSDRCAQLLKRHKLAQRTASELLASQKPLNRIGLVSLIIAYDLPIILTLEGAELRVLHDRPSTGALVRQKNGSYQYGDAEWMEEWRPSHVFEVAGKPLLAISGYKLAQLRSMASALRLPTDGLKKDVYARLSMMTGPN